MKPEGSDVAIVRRVNFFVSMVDCRDLYVLQYFSSQCIRKSENACQVSGLSNALLLKNDG